MGRARHLEAPNPVAIYLCEPSVRSDRVGGKSILTVIKSPTCYFPILLPRQFFGGTEGAAREGGRKGGNRGYY